MAYASLATSTLAKAIYPDTGQLGPNQFLPPGTLVREVRDLMSRTYGLMTAPGMGVQDYLASHDEGETWYRYRSWEPEGLQLKLGPITGVPEGTE